MKTMTPIGGLCLSNYFLRLAWYTPWALVFVVTGCTPIVPGSDDGAGAHGPVPALFGADEVWAITSGNFFGPDQSGPILLMRGYGNTIEYVIASKPVPISEPIDALPDPAQVDTALEPVSLGLEFSSASISLLDRTLTARADFIDLAGRNIEVRLTATVCEEAMSSSGPINCELQAPELNLVIGGEVQDAQGVSFRLVRLESCPKSLDIAAPADSQWSLTSIPFLAVIAAPANVINAEAAGELPIPILWVDGYGTQAELAYDSTQIRGSETQGCVNIPGVGDPLPPEAVRFNESSLELDVSMAYFTSTSDASIEGGTCRATFQGDVTYCGLWQPENGGVGAGGPRYVLRIDGAGERDRAVDGASQLDHVYMLITPLASPSE